MRGTADPVTGAGMLAAWRKVHSGPGHGECTAAEAKQARRKQRAEERRAQTVSTAGEGN